MKDIRELLQQIIDQSKDEEATFLYGFEDSSDSDPSWKAVVSFSRKDVSPVIVAAKTKRRLKLELKRYLDGEDVKDIIIRYHQAQIELEQKAIRFHEGLIRDRLEGTPSELPTE